MRPSPLTFWNASSEDLVALLQRRLEVPAGAGVPFHEEVVGDAAQSDAGVPEIGPNLGVVVDVPDEGALHADVRAGRSDPLDRFLGDRSREFDGMRVVAHDRDGSAAGDDASEDVEQIIGIGIGDISLRPVGDALGADANGLDVGQFGVLEDPVDVSREDLRLHHHRDRRR